MPWYKFYADHGPGHQSHSEFYQWRDQPFEDAQHRHEVWEDAFREKDYPIGKVVLVKKLPEAILLSKRAEFLSKLQRARYLLKVTGGQDPVEEHRRELSTILRDWQKHCDRLSKILGCAGITDSVEKKATEVMAELRRVRGLAAEPPSKRKRYLHFAFISQRGVGQYGCAWGTSLADVKKNTDPREHGDLVRMREKDCKLCKEAKNE